MNNYNFSGYALEYPDGKLVALDHSSGGYPYPAETIKEAWIRKNKEELEKYLAAGNSAGLKIIPIKISVQYRIVAE